METWIIRLQNHGMIAYKETWVYSDGTTTTTNSNGPILPAASAEPGTSSFSTDTLTVKLYELILFKTEIQM